MPRTAVRTPRLSDIEGEPVVGRKYLVPCVLFEHIYRGEAAWIPVIGQAHDDAEHLRFPLCHIHKDPRFATRSVLHFLGQSARDMRAFMSSVLSASQIQGEMEERPFLCVRAMPNFPQAGAGGLFAAMERAYETKSVDLKCLRCPHRGLPLQGLPTVNGVVVCPGHGLAWNIETGEAVRRFRTKGEP